jgi:hypothetical protein
MLLSKESHSESWHSRLEELLKKGRYSLHTTRCRIAVARRFVAHLNGRHVAVERVELSDVALFARGTPAISQAS